MSTPKDFLAGGEQTLNNTGYMVASLDPYSQKFVEFASKAPGQVVDIGACYGVATLPALAKGAKKVIATDNDERHLKVLKARVPIRHRSRLECVLGALPFNLSFNCGTISAVLCSRVLHLLREDEIEHALKSIYSWLEVKGRLYLINDTPYIKFTNKLALDLALLHDQRKKLGLKWPGYIANLKDYLLPEFSKISPDFLTLTDLDTLVTVCKRVGFKIMEASFIARSDYPASLQNDGRENAGVIAIKD